jgi:hypothetical protein
MPQDDKDSQEDRAVVDPNATGPEKKRNRPGRASRRRKQKLLDIQRAEDDIRGTCATTTTTYTADINSNIERPSVIPVDRDRVWPAVSEQRTLLQWSTDDEADLVSQLGYLPGNAIRISARTSHVLPLLEVVKNGNLPVALQLYPIAIRDEFAGGKSGRKFKGRKRRQVDGKTEDPDGDGDADDNENDGNTSKKEQSLIEPFPTMFWLTHPLLRVWVSKLELDGLGIRLEQRLASSPESLARMEKAHEAYGQERHELLTQDDLGVIRSRGWEAAFAPTRGVAGIRNHTAVKCLHAHAAHYLSEPEGKANNVIGEWVMQAVADLSQKQKE